MAANPFIRLLRAYNHLLHRHKYPTQMVTGGLLWMSGDMICQAIVPNGDNDDDDKDSWDWHRVARMTAYGMFCSAPIYTAWYGQLERWAHARYPPSAPGTRVQLTNPWLRSLLLRGESNRMMRPLFSRFTAMGAAQWRTWRMIGFKLLADTIIFDPAYLALFFTATTLLEGGRWSEVRGKLREELMHTWAVDVAVWLPIQTANFRLIPVMYQPLIVQSCNIGWNAYLSYVQHR